MKFLIQTSENLKINVCKIVKNKQSSQRKTAILKWKSFIMRLSLNVYIEESMNNPS